MTKFAVVGTDHLHVVELVSGLLEAGAELSAIAPTEDRIGPWLASQHEDARVPDLDAALDGVDIVVTAAIPADRATIGEIAMRAGVRRARRQAGLHQPRAARRAAPGVRPTRVRPTRCCSPSVSRTPPWCAAYELVAAGRIGAVLQTVGLGPHTLNLEKRPDWFFDPARYGGILVDIGSHQVDQFLTLHRCDRRRGPRRRRSARHPEHAGVEVLGEMLLAADTATGYARVDYYTPRDSAPAWGDVRFTVVGTEGFLEVRHVEQTVTVVDGETRETLDCAGETAGWGERYLAGTLFDQEHVFTVSQICLDAEAHARRIPGLTGSLSKGSLTFSVPLLGTTRTLTDPTTARSPRDRLPLRSGQRQDRAGPRCSRVRTTSPPSASGAGPGLNCGGCHRTLERLVREHIARRHGRRRRSLTPVLSAGVRREVGPCAGVRVSSSCSTRSSRPS